MFFPITIDCFYVMIDGIKNSPFWICCHFYVTVKKVPSEFEVCFFFYIILGEMFFILWSVLVLKFPIFGLNDS